MYLWVCLSVWICAAGVGVRATAGRGAFERHRVGGHGGVTGVNGHSVGGHGAHIIPRGANHTAAAAVSVAQEWDEDEDEAVEGPDGGLMKRDGTKYVFMHHIVGNTYPYTPADWASDMRQIAAKGVDAIALNIGSAPWQRAQLTAAYTAALTSGTSLKLFLSFDFTEMPCSASPDVIADLVSRTRAFAAHPAQLRVAGGRPFVSSYGGACLGDAGWRALRAGAGAYVMPFIWGIEGRFGEWAGLDAWYCWGCAWPQGREKKTTSDDLYYADQLGSRFATTVSGGIFTHLASKNFYLSGDDWLPVTRWEQIMTLRSKLTFVEMVTWNDWGESDYYGPFKGAQPEGTYYAEAFPHTAWFDLSAYFIQAFKTGVYPAITKSTIYFWARPHPAAATASQDTLGKPSGHDWTEDSMWAAVFAPSPATVVLSCGSSTKTFSVGSGITKLKIPLAAGHMSVKMIRNGKTVIDYRPTDYTYTLHPLKYNYNAWAGSASATDEDSASSPAPASAPSPSAAPAPAPAGGGAAGAAAGSLTTAPTRAVCSTLRRRVRRAADV